MKNILALNIAILCIMSYGAGCQQNLNEADLVFLNGRIYCVDADNNIVDAIAIKEDKILAIGSAEKMQSYSGPNTRLIDISGYIVIPGLIESHAHLMDLGYASMKLKLNEAETWPELVNMVKAAVDKAKPGEWIRGRGWHQEKWHNTAKPLIDGYPIHKDLSAVSPDNPIYLTHASGHAILTNLQAMKLAGIDRQTPDPPGGVIIRDDKGNPTGIFLENAVDLIYNKLNPVSYGSDQKRDNDMDQRAFQAAMDACIANGITSFHDAGASFKDVDFYKKMCDEGRLPIRLWIMLGESNENLRKYMSDYRILNYGNYHLTVRAVKRFMDGALGSHGAWLLSPYSDLESSLGLPTTPMNEMYEVASLAIEHDFQLCTHAIGDRGNRETLDLYEEIYKKHPEKTDLRWRIEHAQHLAPEDIPRFSELGVIAAMQTVHCISDGPWVPKRLGNPRSEEGAYVWKKLRQSGAVICNGSDAPVEDLDPMANFFAAVTRKLSDGNQFYPNERMTRAEALRSYTIDGAYAAFEEEIKGSLIPGKLADMVVLDKNIMEVDEENIRSTRILATIIGGKIYNIGLNSDRFVFNK